MVLKFLTIFLAVLVAAHVNGDHCHNAQQRIAVTHEKSADGLTTSFILSQPTMVRRLNLLVCDQDRSLADGTFNVTFIDASDYTQQERVYSEEQTATWAYALSQDAYAWMVFEPSMYTRKFSVRHWHAIQCSTLHVYGCSPQEMFDKSFCKNGGTAVGKELCACPTGYMGSACEKPISDMTFDDFDFVVEISNKIFTNDAAFNVSGDVSFTFDDQIQRRNARLNKRSHHHHGHAHFFGHGGSLHYSSSNLAGFLHSSHHTYGHHPSHSIYSGISNLLTKGFSHTVNSIFGHNHQHSHTHYFYTTHGTNHYSQGASLHYNNHYLNMHVHYANSHGHHHHFHLHLKWNPRPHIKYNIVSSFHPHHGASLFINGHHVASLAKPTSTSPQTSNFPGIPTPLCFGLCGSKPGTGAYNITMGNIAVAGANVATLAKNFLLGLLGLPMLNLLAPNNNLSTKPVQPTNLTTSTTPQPTTTTNKATATAYHGGFTLAPKSTSPATATTVNVLPTTTPPSSAPICYACTNMVINGMCSKQSQCYAGEVCSVFHTNRGFTSRCMGKTVCDNNKKTATGCWNCCTGNLCNKICSSVGTCRDAPKCSTLRMIGYGVCNDPVVSATICPKTCNKCQSSG